MKEFTEETEGCGNGAALLLDVLAAEGVEFIFGNHGTTEMPLMHALKGHPQLQYILGLQETAVVAMADGYAQASGKPAFINLHTAGGLGHAMGALLHAHVAKTPLLVTAGQQDTRHGFTNPLLHGDVLGVAAPAMKWAREVSHPDQLSPLIRRALQDSQTVPRGPVFLSLPVDVLNRPVNVRAGKGSCINRDSVAGGLEELASALADISPVRLAIIAGDEITQSAANAAFDSVVAALGAKVFGPSWPGSMAFAPTHPLWQGNLPSDAAGMRTVLSEFDAVFVVGANPFISYLYTDGPSVPAHCALFQLTEDGGEPGTTFATNMACVGNLKVSLCALLPILTAKMAVHRKQIASLYREASAARRERLAAMEERYLAEKDCTPITPFVAAGAVLAAVGANVAIVDESPATMYHVRAFLERNAIQRYFFMRSAILGWGLPAAVGVSLGRKRAPVVALLGDGSSLYSPQGLWTAAKQQLPVTFIIMNNAEYNILKRYSVAQGYEAGTIPGMEINDPAIDYRALATAMGVKSRRVTLSSEISDAVREAVASLEPRLIEIVIGAE
ncbi:thiamine pyrophosphate-dependent enzyme [Sodalis praecaptivus]|nr:thiamine pyrophosphate-dependent enzyme [Sodalis praecaptivus]